MPQLPHEEPRVLPLGDAAFTVEFGHAIDPAIHARVLGCAQALHAWVQDGRVAGVVEWVPTFRSLTVHFDPDQADAACLAETLLTVAHQSAPAAARGGRWRIPVCFDPDFGPDLADLAAAKGLSQAEILGLMIGTVFRVYMLGFLPGFPYLGGLPDILEVPRLANPRKIVPAGSVAVAGRMCAAYPWESPGGWRLLGRTPVPLFDVANARRPALLTPGDEVCWQAVERDEYERIGAEVAAGRFDAASLRTGDS